MSLGADLTSILDEIDDIVDYARTYLRIRCDNYSEVWYQLYSSPDSTKWPNIMLVSELLLSLPFSTAKVERLFSTLKIIKNERTNLSCSTLNDLLEVNTEGPTLSKFSADAAVDLWWSDCSFGRRVNQKPCKEYRRHKQSSSTVAHTSGDSESENELDLDIWDDWFHTDSSDSSD